MRARYYDASIGRFISRDPVEGSMMIPQSQNGYGFVHGDPINLSDPSGKAVDNQSNFPVAVRTEDGIFRVVPPNSSYGGNQDGVILRDGTIAKNNNFVDVVVTSSGKVGYDIFNGILDRAQNNIKTAANSLGKNLEYSGYYRVNDGTITGSQFKPNICF